MIRQVCRRMNKSDVYYGYGFTTVPVLEILRQIRSESPKLRLINPGLLLLVDVVIYTRHLHFPCPISFSRLFAYERTGRALVACQSVSLQTGSPAAPKVPAIVQVHTHTRWNWKHYFITSLPT
jgi:hypothetical protein